LESVRGPGRDWHSRTGDRVERCGFCGQRRAGRIIDLASVPSFAVNIQTPLYDAAKAAVVNLTRNMALAPHDVLVTAIAPGPIMTEAAHEVLSPDRQEQFERMTPLGRSGRPRRSRLWLPSWRPTRQDFTGVTIPVDGGFLADHLGMR
jgi:2-deoxy-D-gluconate 3-dehydrogenase